MFQHAETPIKPMITLAFLKQKNLSLLEMEQLLHAILLQKLKRILLCTHPQKNIDQ